MSVKQVSALELKQRIDSHEPLILLDVREPDEFQYARIEGSQLIPLNQLPLRLGELDLQQETVVICHHGMRSQQAALFLVQSGFAHIANLSGGIDAWSCYCDEAVRRY
jgi:rhodanese-related sulfurtransferase